MPTIKLTPEDVAGIHYGHTVEGLSMKALAVIYRVSRIQIWRILRSKQHKKSSALRAKTSVTTGPDASKQIVQLLKSRGL